MVSAFEVEQFVDNGEAWQASFAIQNNSNENNQPSQRDVQPLSRISMLLL